MPRHTIFRGVAGAFIVAACLATAQAQEIAPDHLALARKYVDMTDTGAVYEQAVLEVAVRATRSLIGQNPDLTQPISDASAAVINSYRDQKDALFNQFARIYAIHFTPEELGEIIAFYETDVGQRLIGQLPAINKELELALDVYRTNLSSEFMSRLRAGLAEQGYTF